MAANDVSRLNALGGYNKISNYRNKETVWCVFDFQSYGFGFRNSL